MSEIKFQHGHLESSGIHFYGQERLTVERLSPDATTEKKKDNFEKTKKQKHSFQKKCFCKDRESQ